MSFHTLWRMTMSHLGLTHPVVLTALCDHCVWKWVLPLGLSLGSRNRYRKVDVMPRDRRREQGVSPKGFNQSTIRKASIKDSFCRGGHWRKDKLFGRRGEREGRNGKSNIKRPGEVQRVQRRGNNIVIRIRNNICNFGVVFVNFNRHNFGKILEDIKRPEI